MHIGKEAKMRGERQIREAIAVLEVDKTALMDIAEVPLTFQRMISVKARIDELKWVLGEIEY